MTVSAECRVGDLECRRNDEPGYVAEISAVEPNVGVGAGPIEGVQAAINNVIPAITVCTLRLRTVTPRPIFLLLTALDTLASETDTLPYALSDRAGNAPTHTGLDSDARHILTLPACLF